MPNNTNELSQQDAKDAIEKYGSVNKAAKELGIPRTTFRRRLDGTPPAQTTTKVPKTSDKKPIRKMSLEDIRSKHDLDYIIPQAIEKAIEKLGEEYSLYELDFCKLAGISTSNIAKYRDQYEEYWCTPRDSKTTRIWCGSVEMANSVRRRIS